MGLGNQGHVRYPLYNAYENETLKKWRKERKPHWKTTPSKYNASKNKEGKTIDKQLCPSLQDNHARSGTSAQ
jgi:hypothetical protein